MSLHSHHHHPKKLPRKADVIVGQNIRRKRLACKKSQTALAESMGITFQQIQKYEKGVNRVGASRLIQIANTLSVPVTELLEGAGEGVGETRPDALLDLGLTREGLRLAEGFNRIHNHRVRMAIVALVEAEAERK